MMKIDVKDGVASVYTPYNPDFVRKIKGIGGAKWNGSKKCWTIPDFAVEAAREIMCDVYGYSDITTNETVTLKITVNEEIRNTRDDICLFGKTLAHATGRDSGARVGDDVAYVAGEATSGGSRNSWDSVVSAGSVIILSNVNKTVYEKTEVPYNIKIEIVESKVNRQQLLDEKERLLKRLAEIENLLQEA